jgi:hypothetical protein
VNPGDSLRTVILHLRGIGDIAFAETGDQPASNDQKDAQCQEPEIIGCLMTCTLAHVVQPENLMVDETLNEVEDAPADEHPSEKRLTADCPPPPRRPLPEKQDAHRDRDPGGGMEESIGERVVFQPSDGGLRVIRFAAQQVVPLEDLMEDNAVHEPPETDPDQNSWRSRTARRLFFRKARWYLPFGHGSHARKLAHTEEAKTRRSPAKADYFILRRRKRESVAVARPASFPARRGSAPRSDRFAHSSEDIAQDGIRRTPGQVACLA